MSIKSVSFKGIMKAIPEGEAWTVAFVRQKRTARTTMPPGAPKNKYKKKARQGLKDRSGAAGTCFSYVGVDLIMKLIEMGEMDEARHYMEKLEALVQASGE